MITNNKNAALISYLVKRLHTKKPKFQIGKTVIQKMMYLAKRQGITNMDFTMYHYGPYSDEVSGEIETARQTGALEINWKPDYGYFVLPRESGEIKLESLLNTREKKVIDNFIDNYSKFNAIELSIVATALYIKDNFDVTDNNEIIEIVTSLKPQYKERIKKILKRAAIVN